MRMATIDHVTTLALPVCVVGESKSFFLTFKFKYNIWWFLPIEILYNNFCLSWKYKYT